MAVGPQETVITPRFSRGIGVVIVAIGVITELSLISYGHVAVLLRATPAIAFVLFGVYVFFWAPRLRLDPQGVDIVNPLRTVRLQWTEISDITARWAVTFVSGDTKYQAWAAPADSQWSSLGRLRRDAVGRPSLAKEDSRSGRSGHHSAAAIVLDQWNSFRETTPVAAERAAIRWHVPTIAVLVALAILTIVGAAWS